MSTLIRDGTVYLEQGPSRCDLLIERGKISTIGKIDATQSFTREIDATGLHVLPGLIDFHVHLDDSVGPFEIADNWQTGSAAAVCSGVTTLVSFATQRSGETLKQSLQRGLVKAASHSHCDYSFHLTPTSFTASDWTDIEALIDQGFSTFKFYTTYKDAGLYTDYDHLEEIMNRLAKLGCTILIHCEDEEVIEKAAQSPGDLHHPAFHGILRPEEAEITAIARVLEIAERNDAQVHIVHVSTSAGAALIEKARSKVRVFCETAPHYLWLDDGMLSGDSGHRYLCTPPLRAAKVRSELEELAASGNFDIFATDHCPFTRSDKDLHREITRVPNGLAGVGALVPLMHGLMVKKHGRGMPDLVHRLATMPAWLAGLYPRKGTIAVGSDADLVVLDPEGPERPVVSSISDCYETYPDRTTNLDFKYVFVRGEPIVSDNELIDPEKPRGNSVWQI